MMSASATQDGHKNGQPNKRRRTKKYSSNVDCCNVVDCTQTVEIYPLNSQRCILRPDLTLDDLELRSIAPPLLM